MCGGVFLCSAASTLCARISEHLGGFGNFVTLITGWISCPGRHSISRVIQAASSAAGEKHHSAFYRFLSAGAWTPDSLAQVVLTLLLPFLRSQVTVIVDDTLCHKSDPHIFGANMHFDSAKSTYGRGTSAGRKAFFAFGHNWVVLALWIQLPWNRQRGLAIPFLFTGSILLEAFFGIPGLGSMTFDAIAANDFSTLRTMVFVGSLLFIFGQIATDISYGLVDPRVRFE